MPHSRAAVASSCGDDVEWGRAFVGQRRAQPADFRMQRTKAVGVLGKMQLLAGHNVYSRLLPVFKTFREQRLLGDALHGQIAAPQVKRGRGW